MQYQVLTTFSNYMDAHLCLMHLQEAGINCWLKDEHTVTIDPLLTNAVGGIKLMVYTGQLQRAAALVQEMQQRQQEAVVDPPPQSTTGRKEGNWLTKLLINLRGFLKPRRF